MSDCAAALAEAFPVVVLLVELVVLLVVVAVLTVDVETLVTMV